MSIYDISYHLWNIDGQFLHCIIRIRTKFFDFWSYKSCMPLGYRSLEIFCLSTGKLSEKKMTCLYKTLLVLLLILFRLVILIESVLISWFNGLHLLTGLRVISILLMSRGTINLLLPEYPANKCFIIKNSIRDYITIDIHRTCLTCLLLLPVSFGHLV